MKIGAGELILRSPNFQTRLIKILGQLMHRLGPLFGRLSSVRTGRTLASVWTPFKLLVANGATQQRLPGK